MVERGFQPDQRLDYLVPGFKRGDFVVYVLVDGRTADRADDVRAAGARVRWVFRSVNAVSVVASKKVVLDLASKPWVRALYPVDSGRVREARSSISGSMTRGDPPRSHPIDVPAGSRSITVDLLVGPPGQPHTDANAADFLEARLVTPLGRTVMVRAAFLHQIAFRYGEPAALQPGKWSLEMWYRSANHPTAPLVYTYTGEAVVDTAPAPRDATAPIPTRGCAGSADTSRWKKHPNLKRRGVTDMGAPTLWDGGIRGRGVRVAVLDTGTDSSHNDLDDQDWERWGASGCEPKVIADALFSRGEKLPGQGAIDTDGHGTHVGGEIAGTAEGRTDTERAAYPGVAPEASLIAGRIAVAFTALSDDMLAAGEWAVIDQQADVVNLSFGIDVRYGVLTDQNDPQVASFEALVTNPAWGHPSHMNAAGNSGDLFHSISAPGSASHVNTIAAATKDWDLVLKQGETRENGATNQFGTKDAAGRVHPSITNFSSRGPSPDFFFAPDLSAPGRSIVAPLTNQNTDGEQNGYASFSGTSMASPHAAGSAALLVDAYRQRFGAAGSFRNRPPFWIVAAALSNTAGAPAPRPAFAGGTLAKVTYAAGPDGLFLLYGETGSREDATKPLSPVGPLVEGAGRVNLPAALSTMTEGVLIYTSGDPGRPASYELQPSIQAGTAKPLETVSRRLSLDPPTAHTYSVSLRAVSGAPSVNAGAIQPSWWTLPGGVTVLGGTTSQAEVALTPPAGTRPGYYTGYLLADVRDGATGKRWSLRLPAFLVVEVTDASASEGAGARAEMAGYTKAVSPALLYTSLTGVASDWPLYAIEAPEGLSRLDLHLAGTSGASDVWDLFVYDRYGMVVAETLNALPSEDATLSLSNLAPGPYRVAVSLTIPSEESAGVEDPRGVPFRLTADLIGAASPVPRVKGAKFTAPRQRPRPGPLPATGVPAAASLALGALALGLAALLRRALARR